jgi:hypothetical protein
LKLERNFKTSFASSGEMWDDNHNPDQPNVYQKMVNAKKILIESETTETFRLRITGPQTIRSYCSECGRVEEMLDLNSAADISGAAAREIFSRVELGELHAPEIASGHLMICRGSLEQAINTDTQLRPALMVSKESL